MSIKRKTVCKVGELPDQVHYVIIRQGSAYIPGDERSRTNPGHGYPASTEYFLTYEAFAKREDWEEEVADLSQRREAFRAIVVQPAKITTSVSVAVSA